MCDGDTALRANTQPATRFQYFLCTRKPSQLILVFLELCSAALDNEYLGCWSTVTGEQVKVSLVVTIYSIQPVMQMGAGWADRQGVE